MQPTGKKKNLIYSYLSYDKETNDNWMMRYNHINLSTIYKNHRIFSKHYIIIIGYIKMFDTPYSITPVTRQGYILFNYFYFRKILT